MAEVALASYLNIYSTFGIWGDLVDNLGKKQPLTNADFSAPVNQVISGDSLQMGNLE